MHSSRMRTGRSLTVCCSVLPGGVLLGAGGYLPGPGGSPWSGGGGFSLLGGSPWSGGGVCLVQGVLLGPGGVLLVSRGVLPAGGVVLPVGGSPWSGEGGGVSLVPGGFSGDRPRVQNHRHVAAGKYPAVQLNSRIVLIIV